MALKKRVRVEHVVFHDQDFVFRPLADIAKELENELTDLDAGGYEVEVIETPKGYLLLGRAQEDALERVEQLMDMIAPEPTPAQVDELALAAAKKLIRTTEAKINGKTGQEDAVASGISEMMAALTTEQGRRVLEALEQHIYEHDAHHEEGHCAYGELINEIAEKLEASLKLRTS